MLKKPVETWKTYQLFLIGPGCFVFSAFYLFVLSDVVPGLLRVSNTTPFEQWWPQGIRIWVMCAVLAIFVWPATTMAQRCHEVLKDRYFR